MRFREDEETSNAEEGLEAEVYGEGALGWGGCSWPWESLREGTTQAL